MQAKFYADENVPVAVSKVLKNRGIDIVSVRGARMLGRSDRRQLSFALEEERVIVTHDSDFLRLVKEEKIPHFGIIFFTRQMKIGEALEEIERINLMFTAEDLKNNVLFVPFERKYTHGQY